MSPPEVLGCPHCGALQEIPDRHLGVLDCAACHGGLERFSGRSLDAALATASAALLLLLPANLLPFLTTSVLGAVEHSHLGSSFTTLWGQGWYLLALVIGFVIVVAPVLRFTLLTVVLACLRLQLRPHWLGRAFRWSNSLQTWAMVDVFMLAFWISYARLSATVSVVIGPGAYCFMAAGLLTLLSRATLDKKATWRLIMAQPRLSIDRPVLSCEGCELLVSADEEGQACTRCDKKLEARKRNAVGRTAALTVAAVIFYAPANIFPIATIPINLHPSAYNILGGVRDLLAANVFGLALLVFLASFLVPIGKLAALSWFIHSVRAHSRKRLVVKTRLFKLVDEIGRWSMVDPLTIACFTPVVHFNTLLTARAEPAASFFTGVVILTILAAKAFDSRLMWDVAEINQ